MQNIPFAWTGRHAPTAGRERGSSARLSDAGGAWRSSTWAGDTSPVGIVTGWPMHWRTYERLSAEAKGAELRSWAGLADKMKLWRATIG